MNKKLLTIFAAILIAANVLAQAPHKMSYQAIVRNAGNNLVVNTQVGMRISILKDSSTGTVVFVETQKPTTNANGLVSFEVGNGTAVKGGMDTIDWEKGPYFLQTETDPLGGTNYTISGASQLLSVPYALNARNGGFSHFMVLSSSTTATIPSGITKIMVEVWGGGGAGSGYSGGGTASGGNGGGAGGYGKGIYSVLPGQQYQVTVGAGGTGVVGSDGGSGGTSSFGGLISANGGDGGAIAGQSGSGGNSSAAFNIRGGRGANGGNYKFGGAGGSAGVGGSGGWGNDKGNSPGGGGGGTEYTGNAGGNGAPGLVVVWY